MAKLIYTMGEVAQLLGENTSAVRYWSNYFEKFIKPDRNAKGNRLYHPEDVETLRQIQFLVKKQGLTLEGAAHKLLEDMVNEGLFEALEKGIFADIKRSKTGGKGLAGVVTKGENYFNPFIPLMKGQK